MNEPTTQVPTWRKVLPWVLKWGFAFGLVYILLRSGKLNLDDVKSFLSHPLAGLLVLLVCATSLLGAFTRWFTLMRCQGIKIPFGLTLQLGMLGHFFSALIPGTVSGDVVKAVYVARRFPKQKTMVVSTVIMDRLVGLAMLVVLAGATFLLGKHRLSELPGTELVLAAGWTFVTVGGCILAALLLLPYIGQSWPAELPEKWKDKLPAAEQFAGVYKAAKAYQSRTRYLWIALLASAVVHLGSASGLYIAARTIFGAPPWGGIDTPLFIFGAYMGFAAMAVPIAPMGLGVGQVAFSALFHLLGAESNTFGASIITSFQVIALTLNFAGAFFFAAYRHEVHADLESAADLT